ncbi:hypothetical protein BDF20DRAFT_843240 [Mycotypha africana]|uniref:uncharacterized protein n=1 Tax=Mycotypha africana TaxID=64632 RepID=UPI0023002C52|nr:uncharacterized protein BDF20DRAFT_843240 [Mycotypha africana]KAI8991196.1 hypothetical protein BDF20DRAFT_843240 [Mycotypha africana]
MSSKNLITELRPIDLSLAKSKPTLIAASPTVSIRTALMKMHRNKITSLPVFSHQNCTDIMSIVNLFDILLYLVNDSKCHDTTIQKENLKKLDDPIELVLGLDSDRESYRIHKLDRKDKLIEALRSFASGTHRALVMNFDTNDEPWILSQTDIIQHIVRHPDSVSGLLDLNCPVRDMPLMIQKQQKLITAKESETALHVYRFMAEKNLSGVPVVNEQGEFIGDLCVEDLPAANLENIGQMTLSCKEYIKFTSDYLTPSVTSSNSTLKDIMNIMIKTDTHRVWILEDKKVISVVTMSDIMALLCSNRRPSLF